MAPIPTIVTRAAAKAPLVRRLSGGNTVALLLFLSGITFVTLFIVGIKCVVPCTVVKMQTLRARRIYACEQLTAAAIAEIEERKKRKKSSRATTTTASTTTATTSTSGGASSAKGEKKKSSKGTKTASTSNLGGSSSLTSEVSSV